MPQNPWLLHKKTRQYDKPFQLATSEGEVIVGKFTDPESPNQPFGHVLEARGSAGQDYRWVFNSVLTDISMSMILKGLKLDPEFRKQFAKPDAIVLHDTRVIADAVQSAFGDHEILDPGTAEPTAHSWEQNTSVVLKEKPPKPFTDFLSKFPGMKLTKAKGGFHLMVTSAMGHASEANQVFLTVLSDFANGVLLAPKAYKYDRKTINTKPTRPSLPQAQKSQVKIDLEQSIEKINASEKEAATLLIEKLKAGRDEFTTMKADALKDKIEPEELNRILTKFHVGTQFETKKRVSQASQCMRWRLRGLSLDQAMLKVDFEAKSDAFFAERSTSLNAFN
ncbi:hypothetical protein [Pseudomonas serbica]|uniref:hypothetical protein n=1 Tax=Pseudomonas serbica TaxID=2965074 RepID=UPI00237C333C|nr:hypothetical protein [Pseudomonas serbica]